MDPAPGISGRRVGDLTDFEGGWTAANRDGQTLSSYRGKDRSLVRWSETLHETPANPGESGYYRPK